MHLHRVTILIIAQLAGIIVTRHLTDAAATTPKVKLKIIDFVDPGGTNQNVTSTSYVDLTGVSFTYTSGATNERLFLISSAMIQGSDVNTFMRIVVNGTPMKEEFETARSGGWTRLYIMGFADIPANTTVTIKAQGYVIAGSVAFGRDATQQGFRTKITGFAMSNA